MTNPQETSQLEKMAGDAIKKGHIQEAAKFVVRAQMHYDKAGIDTPKSLLSLMERIMTSDFQVVAGMT